MTHAPAQKGWNGPTYLHPYACFSCRVSFKRAAKQNAVLPCPNCGGPAIGLTRKFKPPKRTEVDRWLTVEALVRRGFLFWSIGDAYPMTVKEVEAFARRNAQHVDAARARYPEAFAEIHAALNQGNTPYGASPSNAPSTVR